jgi:hypothetical protein
MAEMNAFVPSNVLGQRISGSNVLSCEFYSATATDTITPGKFVKLSSTTKGNVSKVVVTAAASDDMLGVVLSKPMKESFAVGDIIEVGLVTTIVPVMAGATITAGAALEHVPATGKVATKSTGAKIGIALENGTADNLIRVMLEK